ncbi:hypothetical protein EB061_06315 [bacterium]|jgi:hypothetical protein|nr:hypothetical protein [bacterium]
MNLIVVLVASLMTWNALAKPLLTQAAPLEVHVMDNLEPSERTIALKELRRLGYQPTQTPLFTKSIHAVIITKVMNDSLETESFSFEVVRMKKEEALPKSIFEMRSKEKTIQDLFKNAPGPEQVQNWSQDLMPVAALR